MTIEWAYESYERVDCGQCGIIFYAPAEFVKNRRASHENFWCPNGHGLHYGGKTEADKYKELYEKEHACCKTKAEKLQTVSAEARRLTCAVNGYKGKIVQMKNQIMKK